MDLKIKWNNGTMTIHIEEFLKNRKITKFRKLIKMIQQGDNPAELIRIKDYLLNHVDQFDPIAKKQMKEQKDVTTMSKNIDLKGKKDKDFYLKCISIIESAEIIAVN